MGTKGMSTYAVATHVMENGGGTFWSAHGTSFLYQTKDADNAWVVAIDPQEGHEGEAYTNRVFNESPFDESVIAEDLFDFLTNSYSPNHVFGLWVDQTDDGVSHLYIDHVQVTTRDAATRLAKIKGELAIYNLITEETVRFDGKGE